MLGNESMCLSSVVFPLPRKPVSNVSGILARAVVTQISSPPDGSAASDRECQPGTTLPDPPRTKHASSSEQFLSYRSPRGQSLRRQKLTPDYRQPPEAD